MTEITFSLGFLAMALSFLYLARAMDRTADRLLPPAPSALQESPGAEELPLDIKNLIDMESEAWAQSDLEVEAARLWEIHKDWAIVHMHLLQQVGSPVDREATWDVVAEDQNAEEIAEGF